MLVDIARVKSDKITNGQLGGGQSTVTAALQVTAHQVLLKAGRIT